MSRAQSSRLRVASETPSVPSVHRCFARFGIYRGDASDGGEFVRPEAVRHITVSKFRRRVHDIFCCFGPIVYRFPEKCTVFTNHHVPGLDSPSLDEELSC